VFWRMGDRTFVTWIWAEVKETENDNQEAGSKSGFGKQIRRIIVREMHPCVCECGMQELVIRDFGRRFLGGDVDAGIRKRGLKRGNQAQAPGLHHGFLNRGCGPAAKPRDPGVKSGTGK